MRAEIVGGANAGGSSALNGWRFNSVANRALQADCHAGKPPISHNKEEIFVCHPGYRWSFLLLRIWCSPNGYSRKWEYRPDAQPDGPAGRKKNRKFANYQRVRQSTTAAKFLSREPNSESAGCLRPDFSRRARRVEPREISCSRRFRQIRPRGRHATPCASNTGCRASLNDFFMSLANRTL